MDYLKWAREKFSDDIYATETTGISIDFVQPGESECSLNISHAHMNAAGTVMGGAIFTLADFAFAVAANCEMPLTVSLTSQIIYLSAARGEKLICRCKCKKAGKTTCYYASDISDDRGNIVASVTTTGFIKR